tara:strand:+ start:2821 stop:3228 length:408 start_codon:yes stop_codon:yes gene_type:complete
MVYKLNNTKYGYNTLTKDGKKILIQLQTTIFSNVIKLNNRRYIQIMSDNEFELLLKEISEFCNIHFNKLVWIKLPYKYDRYNIPFTNSDCTLASSAQLLKGTVVNITMELIGVSNFIHWNAISVEFVKEKSLNDS